MKTMNLSELSIAFNKILSKLELEDSYEIKFNHDLYRVIPTEKWDSFDDLIIDNCSLFDDIDQIKQLGNDGNRVCTYVDFDRVASILRAISQINNPV